MARVMFSSSGPVRWMSPFPAVYGPYLHCLWTDEIAFVNCYYRRSYRTALYSLERQKQLHPVLFLWKVSFLLTRFKVQGFVFSKQTGSGTGTRTTKKVPTKCWRCLYLHSAYIFRLLEKNKSI